MVDEEKPLNVRVFWQKLIHQFFVIELDQEENSFERVSYSYADVLTETVQLTFYDETTGNIVLGQQ